MKPVSKKRVKRTVWHLKDFERLAQEAGASEDADVLYQIRCTVLELFEEKKRAYELGRQAGQKEAQQ